MNVALLAGHVLTVAGLRVREGVTARLWALVPVGFLVGLGAALWVPGADDAARAAAADRVAVAAVAGLAVLAAVIPAAATFPGELRTGAAQRLLATPLSRLATVIGGAVGHGTLASLLLVGTLMAALLGLEAGGLGSTLREPIRLYAPVAFSESGDVFVSRDQPLADFQFVLSKRAVSEGELFVRVAPRPRAEGGDFTRKSTCLLTLSQPAHGVRTSTPVEFAVGLPFTARLTVGEFTPEETAILTVQRGRGTWGLLLAPGSIEIGGGRELFARTVLIAGLCVVPLLFLLAAAAGVGAARFSAPTAMGLALFVLVVFAGQGILRDGANYVVRTAEAHVGHDHAADAHDAEVSATQLALARAALAGLRVVPPIESFDRTADLLDRRAVDLSRVGGALRAAAPGFVVLLLLGWGLLARRELLPT